MRKVVAVELVSVDGVMEKPEEWAFSYSNDEMEQVNAAGMVASDAMLLGRVTYEALAESKTFGTGVVYLTYQLAAE
jgi:dihydrofolate reductase